MKLRFTTRAIRDIAEIAHYIRAENPGAAERVRTAILESLEGLVRFPRIGRLQSVEGVRKLVTRKYHYLVYYSVDYSVDEPADEIVILTVQHPSRDRVFSDD